MALLVPAVDGTGQTIDFLLSAKRDKKASKALLQACPRPEAHPQPARGRDRPSQELSRCATRDETEGRAVALRPAPAGALAQ